LKNREGGDANKEKQRVAGETVAPSIPYNVSDDSSSDRMQSVDCAQMTSKFGKGRREGLTINDRISKVEE
jgi:hypothetical protein